MVVLFLDSRNPGLRKNQIFPIFLILDLKFKKSKIFGFGKIV